MKLTIFTPTYNRQEELPGLYNSIVESLRCYTGNNDVEWLIVDDGSKTDLRALVNSFKIIPHFSIRFYRKENGGKHTAYNLAIEKADGDFFVCIDDDDRLTSNAIKDIFIIGNDFLNNPAYKDCGAFVGRVISPQGQKLGSDVTSYPFLSDTIEIRDKYHFWGEPEVDILPILKQYRFNVFENERFLTEAALFDCMSKKHKFLYTNCPLMVKKFRSDGLTAAMTKIRVESPRGAESYYYQRSRLCEGLSHKLKAIINRQRFAYWIKSDVPKRPFSLLEFYARPISFVMFLKDLFCYMNRQ